MYERGVNPFNHQHLSHVKRKRGKYEGKESAGIKAPCLAAVKAQDLPR
jgi:hypothetical protein